MAEPKPFIAAAFVCERVLQEGTVYSAIRIVDTWTRHLAKIPGASPSSGETPVVAVDQPFDMSALVMVKAGSVVGKHAMALSIRNPQNKTTRVQEEFTIDFALNDPAETATLRARFMLPGDSLPGLYWIDVLWDEELLTSIPLKIVQAVDGASPSGA